MDVRQGQNSEKDNYQDNDMDAAIKRLDRTIALAEEMCNSTPKEDYSDEVETQSAQQDLDVAEEAADELPRQMLITLTCKVSIWEYDKEHTEWEDMAELSDEERMLEEYAERNAREKARDMEWRISAVKKVGNKRRTQNGDMKEEDKTAEPVKQLVNEPTRKS